MSVKNYISDAKTCKTFKGDWNPKTNKCNPKEIKDIIDKMGFMERDRDTAMQKINKKIKGFGVEAVRGKPWVSHYFQDINLLYVNKGDTYEPTVIYDAKKDTWYVGTSWGALVEADMKRFDV